MTTWHPYPRPKLLTPREVEAINRQCIKRVYDEFDRESEGAKWPK